VNRKGKEFLPDHRAAAGYTAKVANNAAILTLRPAVLADLSELVEIQSLSPEAAQWTQQDYRQLLLGAGASQCVAAELLGRLAGFVVFQRPAPDEIEILNLAVSPTQRRKGAGKRLLGHVLGLGAAEIFLEVRAGNEPAQAFYRQAGFHPAGRRAGYYRNPAEDAVVMRLTTRAGCS
jgi:[ribosomal protein S18]-alanine N-acetyltransferase